MSQLISSGTLAKPVPKTIETNVDIETIIDDKEIAHIQRLHEMPESLVTKIARTNTRNDLIVDEYVNNADKYGKTIIFALNGIHCMALDDAFKAVSSTPTTRTTPRRLNVSATTITPNISTC